MNAFVSLESFYNYNFFGPRKNPGNLVVWLSSSVYNNSFTEKFGNFCINIFTFQKREIGTNWYNGISANSIIKPKFTICTTNWSCAIFARFQKFFMLPPLNVSTFSLRVAIGKWQFTIFSILKSISMRSVLIQSSFSSFYVCGDFIELQFGYCLLIWVFHSRGANNKINYLHEWSLRIVYKDNISSFRDLLKKG